MNENFLTSLEIMWQGMFGIFSVIILITLIVILIQKCEQFIQYLKLKINQKKDDNLNKTTI